MKKKESVATKIKRLLPHVPDFKALRDIEVAVKARRQKMLEDDRERTNAAAMDAAELRIKEGRVAVMIDPERVGVSASGIVPGFCFYLRKIHRGRKWKGCYISATADAPPGKWQFVRTWDLHHIVDFDPSPANAAKAASARQMTRFMGKLFGAVK